MLHWCDCTLLCIGLPLIRSWAPALRLVLHRVCLALLTCSAGLNAGSGERRASRIPYLEQQQQHIAQVCVWPLRACLHRCHCTARPQNEQLLGQPTRHEPDKQGTNCLCSTCNSYRLQTDCHTARGLCHNSALPCVLLAFHTTQAKVWQMCTYETIWWRPPCRLQPEVLVVLG